MNLVEEHAQYRDTYNRNYQEQGLNVIPLKYVDEVKPWKVADKPTAPKHKWLFATLPFLRKPWVALAIIAVIVGVYALVYAWVVALLEW